MCGYILYFPPLTNQISANAQFFPWKRHKLPPGGLSTSVWESLMELLLERDAPEFLMQFLNAGEHHTLYDIHLHYTEVAAEI